MAEARNVYKVWFTTKNGEFVVVDSDPPGKTGESRPKATHAITLSFSRPVTISGEFKLQGTSDGREPRTLKVKLKKDADGNLEVVGSDPPGKADKFDATHELVITTIENATAKFDHHIDRF